MFSNAKFGKNEDICIALIQLTKRGSFEISLIDLTLPHVCACPKPGLGFPTYNVCYGFFHVQ
jgi:hypothetical protein